MKLAGCTVNGTRGNGTERGSCIELHRCHSDGKCKPDCTVLGSPGDDIQRGNCPEGLICTKQGVCRKPRTPNV